MYGEVRVINNWQADSFDVFVFEGPLKEAAMPQRIFRHVEGDTWILEDVGDALGWTARPKPSMSIPRDVFEQMIAQGRAMMPKVEDVSAEALKDARSTRDRLLQVVEGQLPPKRVR